MINFEDLDRLTVIIARLVGGDTHLLTEDDYDLINEACVHAEDVLTVRGEEYIVSYDEEDLVDLDEDEDTDDYGYDPYDPSYDEN